LGGSGQFIVDAYPVSLHFGDVCLIFVTVVVVGFVAVYYPLRYLCKRFIK
jgi:lipoprotein-releasing system permease protein